MPTKFQQVTVNMYYNMHRHNALKRGDKPLLKNEWLALVVKPCHYCGGTDTKSVLNTTAYKKRKTPDRGYSIQINGVDRVDSSRGYEKDNCVPCCGECNDFKSNLTQRQFFEHVRKVHQCQRT
jgi:5-methylcytosine-specific restriction endonuclease McrA